MDVLCVARAEPVWRNCGITVAVSINETAVQMRHHAHLIAERREPRIDRNPIWVCEWQSIGVTHIKRRTALRDHRHSKRTCLPAKS